MRRRKCETIIGMKLSWRIPAVYSFRSSQNPEGLAWLCLGQARLKEAAPAMLNAKARHRSPSLDGSRKRAPLSTIAQWFCVEPGGVNFKADKFFSLRYHSMAQALAPLQVSQGSALIVSAPAMRRLFSISA